MGEDNSVLIIRLSAVVNT